MNRLLILCLFFLPLFAEQEIVVRLATDSKLEPVYVAPWTQDSRRQAISSDEARKLHEVLSFDLNYNGHTHALSQTPERKNQASSERFGTRPDVKRWKDLGARYVVRGHLTGEILALKLFSIHRDQEVGVYQVPLTGDLAEDRRKIHQLSDTLHRALYGTDGVASTRLLYTVKRKAPSDEKPKSEIWICDYDGGNCEQLTRENDFAVHPAFFPPASGRASGGFFYVSYKTGQPKIYMRRLTGGKAELFSKLRGNQFTPAISPRRDQVAFVSDAGGNPDLFLQPFDADTGPAGKPRQIFASQGSAQASPTFSPDGQSIAFVSNKDGAPRIYIMDIPVPGESPKPRMISRENRENTSPTWSPDGTKIAYSSRTDGVRQIWIYDLTSGRESQLTHGAGHKENPSWAPDSLHLICNSSSGKRCDLFLVNLNQPQAVRISQGPGEKRFPAWEPRP